jgi:hypothetical protein
MTEYPDRIPYAEWINSQLSIARFYGGIKVNGKSYVIDKETNDLVIPMSRKKRKELAEKKNKKELSISDEMNFNP